jgi:predicted cobalt transporter CbtA
MKAFLARSLLVAAALFALAGAPAHAHETAQPLSIEGNWFVALMIALVALWSVILLIRGVLHIDERDAWLRRGGNGNDWWIGGD